MNISVHDIEKLKALDFSAKEDEDGWYPWLDEESMDEGPFETEAEAWAHCKSYAQSEFGMLVLMADKVRWLGTVCIYPLTDGWVATIDCRRDGEVEESKADSPQAAVDALFWGAP